MPSTQDWSPALRTAVGREPHEPHGEVNGRRRHSHDVSGEGSNHMRLGTANPVYGPCWTWGISLNFPQEPRHSWKQVILTVAHIGILARVKPGVELFYGSVERKETCCAPSRSVSTFPNDWFCFRPSLKPPFPTNLEV